MMMRLRPIFAALLVLSACAAVPEQRQYLLDAPANATATPLSSPESLTALGLREIALPLYARRAQIASRGADGAITATDDFRWAEEPARASTRLVARILAERLSKPTYVEPWPQGASPDVIATIEVDRFIGALGGEVVLEGQATVAEPGRAGNRRTTRFALVEPVTGPTHADLARAYGAALSKLADVVGEAL